MKEPIALVFEDRQKLVKGLTEFFIGLVNKKEGEFAVSLSGGSTPKIWFQYLAESHKEDIPWERVHFYWGDERCVPPEDQESNFGMTKKFLFDSIPIPDKNIHRIKGELDPASAKEAFAKDMDANLLEDAVPIYDLIILGMGDDGHTASIFPHEIELWNSEENAVVASHPTSGQKRVSITGRVINAAKAVAFSRVS